MILEEETQRELDAENERRLTVWRNVVVKRYAAGIDPGSVNLGVGFFDAATGTSKAFNVNMQMVVDRTTKSWRVAKWTEPFNMYACMQLVHQFRTEFSRASVVSIEKQMKRRFVLMASNLRMLIQAACPHVLVIEVPATHWRPFYGLSVRKEDLMEDDPEKFKRLSQKAQDKKAWAARKQKSVAFVNESVHVAVSPSQFIKEDGKDHADAAEASLIAAYGFLNADKYAAAAAAPELELEFKGGVVDENEPVRGVFLQFKADTFGKRFGFAWSSDSAAATSSAAAWNPDFKTPPRCRGPREQLQRERRDARPVKLAWWMTPSDYAKRGRGKARYLSLVLKSGHHTNRVRVSRKRKPGNRYHPEDADADASAGAIVKRVHVLSLEFL